MQHFFCSKKRSLITLLFLSRTFDDVVLTPNPQLNVIVGPNGKVIVDIKSKITATFWHRFHKLCFFSTLVSTSNTCISNAC